MDSMEREITVAVEVLMPKLGMTMEEGRLTEWTKSDRDEVETGEIICIIETDKVTYEVESPAGGLLLILQEPADGIKVGTRIGYIAENAEAYEKIKQEGGGPAPPERAVEAPADAEKAAESPAEAASARKEAPKGKLRASPAARALAGKLGISISGIQGTGPNGRITTGDVKKAGAAPAARPAEPRAAGEVHASAGARRLAREKGMDLAGIPGTGPNARITRRDVLRALRQGGAAAAAAHAAEAGAAVQRGGRRLAREEPMSTIRHTISCRMMDSLECSAQMTAFGEWDVTELMKLRQVMNGQMAESGLKVTFPGLMVFLLARVLKEMPVFNASVEDRKILYWADVNIGVAVSVGENLVVPVIRGADRKTISGIQETMNDLIERARSRKLMPDDMEGGTFTLSNVGSYGSKWETVILNPPEVALLGIGAVEKKPVVIGDSIEIRQIMPISFTFDHRIIDGATAGRFRQRMKSLVENPGMLITCFPEDEEA